MPLEIFSTLVELNWDNKVITISRAPHSRDIVYTGSVVAWLLSQGALTYGSDGDVWTRPPN